MQNKLPIGVFDSGLGGLTVVHEIRKLLPNEDMVYLGDTARVPYGTRSEDVIKKFAEEDLNYLVNKNVKCIVVACHTASAVAGEYLKDKYSGIKIFDVIKPTIEKVKRLKGDTVVLATKATVKSKAFSSQIRSTDIACPLFVPAIEEGEVEGELIEMLIKKYTQDVKADNLVLACTHYPIIRASIEKIFPDGINIVNPGTCVSEQLCNFLVENDLVNLQNKAGSLDINVTDLNDNFVKVANMFLGESVEFNIQKVEL